MNREPLLWPVFEFRPLPTFFRGTFQRYANSKWIDDDGQSDLAFIGFSQSAGAPICLMIDLPYQRNICWKWLTGHWSGYVNGHPRGNAWHYMLRPNTNGWGGRWERDQHPNFIAGQAGMREMAGRHLCANGSHVDFDPQDKHLLAGLVHERETGARVSIPDKLVCMYGCVTEAQALKPALRAYSVGEDVRRDS